MLRIDLDFLSRITDEEFLNYLCQKIEKYGLKVFSNNQSLDQKSSVPKYPFYMIKTESVGSQQEKLGGSVGFQESKHQKTDSRGIIKQSFELAQRNSQPKNKGKQKLLQFSGVNKMISLDEIDEEEEGNFDFIETRKEEGKESANLVDKKREWTIKPGHIRKTTEPEDLARNMKALKQKQKELMIGKGGSKTSSKDFKSSTKEDMEFTEIHQEDANHHKSGPQQDQVKKLFFVEMRNPQLHVSSEQNTPLKVVALKTHKQEASISIINSGDDQDHQNTVIELIFHMIYIDNENYKQDEG
mmetsp:Transcript_39829/g.38389  ORF Transcript_39829/g.38389 Transcript_39829/m.38389 type:complete len:299 (+) Transcript_39829:1720-2616(+)